VSPRRDREGPTGRRSRQPPPWLLPSLTALVIVLAVVAAVSARARQARPTGAPTSSILPSTSPPVPPTDLRPATSRPPTTATATTQQAATSATTALPASSTRPLSPLQRSTPRPAGLAAQFDLGLGGADTDCRALAPPSADPTISGLERPGLGLLYPVCFYNFSDQAPVQVAITNPLGSVEHRQTSRDPESGTPVLWWGSEPGDPLGHHEIAAVQGSRTAHGSFRLEQQRLRTLRVVQNSIVTDWVQVGATVTVVLAGFQPHGRIQLHTYHLPLRQVSGEYPGIGTLEHPAVANYRSSMGLTMNDRGELIYRIPTTSRDPKGCYAFRTTPSLQSVPGAFDYASFVGPIDRFCLR
jgi:hypothetical protein